MLIHKLLEDADNIANRCKELILARQRQLQKIEDEIHAASLCDRRRPDFQPEVDGVYQCPRCWMKEGKKSPLVPVSGTDEYEAFRCKECRSEWIDPI